MAQIKLKKRVVDHITGDIRTETVRTNIDERNPSRSVEFHAICDYLGIDEFKRHQSYVSSRLVEIYNFFAERTKSPTPEKVYDKIKDFMKAKGVPSIEGAELVKRVSYHVRSEKLREEKEKALDRPEEEIKGRDPDRARELRRQSAGLDKSSEKSLKKVGREYEKSKEEFEKSNKEGKEFPKVKVTEYRNYTREI